MLREVPNTILVGEMRDLETIAAALTLAETGPIVLSTLHTQDAASTVDRIVDVLPYQQEQVPRNAGLNFEGRGVPGVASSRSTAFKARANE